MEPVFAAYADALEKLNAPQVAAEEAQSQSEPIVSPPAPSINLNLSEAQRDRRTVFVQQLSVKCTDADLTQFFNQNGCPVRQSKLVIDRYTRRSKGVAYVEFFEEETVKKALKLTGQRLLGVPLIVELTETEKNRLAEEAAAVQAKVTQTTQAKNQTSTSEATFTRLYVGSLHPSLGEEDLKQLFQPFGHVSLLELLREASTGVSKGVAYVTFTQPESAQAALDALNGFELAGRKIRIGAMKTSAEGDRRSDLMRRLQRD